MLQSPNWRIPCGAISIRSFSMASVQIPSSRTCCCTRAKVQVKAGPKQPHAIAAEGRQRVRHRWLWGKWKAPNGCGRYLPSRCECGNPDAAQQAGQRRSRSSNRSNALLLRPISTSMPHVYQMRRNLRPLLCPLHLPPLLRQIRQRPKYRSERLSRLRRHRAPQREPHGRGEPIFRTDLTARCGSCRLTQTSGMCPPGPQRGIDWLRHLLTATQSVS